MKHATTSFAVLALLALVAACSDGRDGPRMPDLGPPRDMFVARDMTFVPLDMPAAPTDFGTPDLGRPDLGRPDMGSVRRCVASCATDADCQLSCPSNPMVGLPVCCDRGTGTCFNAGTPMCPAPGTGDAGMMMSM